MQFRKVIFSSFLLAATGACAARAPEVVPWEAHEAGCHVIGGDYPVPAEIAESLAPTDLGMSSFYTSIDNLQHGVTEQSVTYSNAQNFYTEVMTHYNRFHLGDIDPKTQDKIESAPWNITIEKLDLPFGYKHLSVLVGPSILNVPYVRIEGAAADPRMSRKPLPPDPKGRLGYSAQFEPNPENLNLFGNATLYGMMTYGESFNFRREPVETIHVDYRTALNFLSKVSQFVAEFNTMGGSLQTMEQQQ